MVSNVKKIGGQDSKCLLALRKDKVYSWQHVQKIGGQSIIISLCFSSKLNLNACLLKSLVSFSKPSPSKEGRVLATHRLSSPEKYWNLLYPVNFSPEASKDAHRKNALIQ